MSDAAHRRARGKARKAAIQALYACDIEHQFNPDRFSAGLVAIKPALQPDVHSYALDMFAMYDRSREWIDKYLREAKHSRRLETMGLIERSVLRLALAELSQGDTPRAVTIAEAVKNADAFAGQEAATFVNALLDKAPQDMGSAE